MKASNFPEIQQREGAKFRRGSDAGNPTKDPPAPPQDQEQGGDWIYKGGSFIFPIDLHLLRRILHHVQRYNV
jgi:hypothetical protein